MRSLLLISIILGIVSCSSSPERKNSGPKQNDEFYWIENEDFTPSDEIIYRPVDDSYDIKPEIPNALSKETLIQATPMDLKVLIESKDPISKSTALCYQQNYAEAFKIFDQNFAKYRNHPSYWNQIGTCYFIKKEFRKAILYYHRARIKGNKSYAPAMNNLGVIYIHQSRYQEALEAFKRASNVNERALTPKLNIVQLFIKFGQLEKAKQMLIKMKDISVDDPSINALLGTISVYQKDYKQALVYYNFLPEKLLWRGDYSINYALALYLNGDTKNARVVISKVNQSRLGSLQQYYQTVKQRIVR